MAVLLLVLLLLLPLLLPPLLGSTSPARWYLMPQRRHRRHQDQRLGSSAWTGAICRLFSGVCSTDSSVASHRTLSFADGCRRDAHVRSSSSTTCSRRGGVSEGGGAKPSRFLGHSADSPSFAGLRCSSALPSTGRITHARGVRDRMGGNVDRQSGLHGPWNVSPDPGVGGEVFQIRGRSRCPGGPEDRISRDSRLRGSRPPAISQGPCADTAIKMAETSRAPHNTSAR